MSDHPLAELFGFPINNFSPEAIRHRRLRLCPFNNKAPSCTKDKANEPLGVCTIFDGSDLAITCPVRFRQDWLIAEDAATFFSSETTNWTSLIEVRLTDKHGRSAGNIDLILVAYDTHGRILDFGALEIQAVYISGNIRQPFTYYMEAPEHRKDMIWSAHSTNPHADYLSSSRKRLAPQLLYKGGILYSWGKKQAVALHENFFRTLPPLPEVPPDQANLAWLIYDLFLDTTENHYRLIKKKIVYTDFQPALPKITLPEPGTLDSFIGYLQEKLDQKLDNENPPDAPTLTDILEPD